MGRDVHSNPFKEIDGAGTPEHLNAVGQWLSENVANNQSGLAGSNRDSRGVWCTNCHNQLSQEIWKNENMEDHVHDIPGPGATNIRALGSLNAIAAAVGVSTQQAIDWLAAKAAKKTTRRSGRKAAPAKTAKKKAAKKSPARKAKKKAARKAAKSKSAE